MEKGHNVTRSWISVSVVCEEKCSQEGSTSLTSLFVVHDDANHCSCETHDGQFLQRALMQTEAFLSSATQRLKKAFLLPWHKGTSA